MKIKDYEFYASLNNTDALKLPEEETVEVLKHDPAYYGKFGQNWHSNSYLKRLLDDPLLVKDDEMWGDGSALVIGNFVHKVILEPEKAKIFEYSEATHRGQTAYKEDLAASSFDRWMFTKKDFDKWMTFGDTILSNKEAKAILHNPNNNFEVPGVAMFNGIPIKGKCDIINHDERLIIDLKTTSDLDTFGDMVDGWGYNMQAALYAKALFPGYDFRFVAVDKRTNGIGVFDVTPEQFEIGLKKLYKSINLLKHYHIKSEDNIFYHRI